MLDRTRQALSQFLLRPSVWRAKSLFLLSHTRSRSTLLSHILGSNSSINGYYESHLSYSNYYSLLKQRFLFAGEHLLRDGGEYFLEKNLHNESFISHSVLKRSDTFCVFLLREPYSSIASMINMHVQYHPDDDRELLAKRFCEYYVGRVDVLKDYWAGVDRNRRLFIDSDSVINDREVTFRSLEKFLSLRNPLSEEYQAFRYTGVAVKGDPSENIKKKRIQDDGEGRAAELNYSFLQRASLAFDAAVALMSDQRE